MHSFFTWTALFGILFDRCRRMLWKVLIFLIVVNVILKNIADKSTAGSSRSKRAAHSHLEVQGDFVIGRSLDQVEEETEQGDVVQTEQGDKYSSDGILQNQTAGLSVWTPFMSLNSYKADHSVGDVKLEAMHWIEVWPNCSDYFSASLKERIVYPYFYGSCGPPPITFPITLAVQMDMAITYWGKLQYTARHWSGPISVGLHIARENDNTDTSGISEELEKRFQKYGLENSSICVHLLLEQTEGEGQYFYPVNSLRNVATKYIETKYVFYIEADFIPMPGLAEHVYGQIKSWNTTRKAFVIPAYRSLSQLHKFPHNKAQLLKEWDDNVIVPWWYERNWKDGHMSTNYHLIPNTNDIYKINYTAYYEPYYVIEKSKSPYYPEEILFGRKDKLTHTTILDKMEYSFYVLPGSFIIHTPHDSTNHTVLSTSHERCADIAFKNIERKIRQMQKLSLKEYLRRNKANRLLDIYRAHSQLRRPEYRHLEGINTSNIQGILIYKESFKPPPQKIIERRRQMRKLLPTRPPIPPTHKPPTPSPPNISDSARALINSINEANLEEKRRKLKRKVDPNWWALGE